MESTSSSGRVTFLELKSRLIKIVNARILNGEFSERGLARILGISQPQVHNVLKGARRLRGDLADRLLTMLGLSVTELLCEEELINRHQAEETRNLPAPETHWRFGIDQSTPKKPPLAETVPRKARHATGN